MTTIVNGKGTQPAVLPSQPKDQQDNDNTFVRVNPNSKDSIESASTPDSQPAESCCDGFYHVIQGCVVTPFSACASAVWYVLTAPFVLGAACLSGFFSWIASLCGAGAEENLSHPFHAACESGDVAALRQMIGQEGFDVNFTDAHGSSLLDYLLYFNHFALIPELINAGANVNAQDKLGTTLLHRLCLARYMDASVKTEGLDEAERLIDIVLIKGADISLKDNSGNTPLHVACKERSHVAAKSVVLASKDLSVDINAVNKNGETPLHLACATGASPSSEKIIQSLKNNGANVMALDKNGRTPLHRFCAHEALIARNVKQKNRALAHGALTIDPRDRKKMILLALSKGHGFNVNARDKSGATALHLACKAGNLKVAMILMTDHQAKPNVADKKGRTPFHYAVIDGKMEMIRALYVADADINARDKQGCTPFFLLERNGKPLDPKIRKEVGQLLLVDLGANPEIGNNKGEKAPVRFAYELDAAEAAAIIAEAVAEVAPVEIPAPEALDVASLVHQASRKSVIESAIFIDLSDDESE